MVEQRTYTLAQLIDRERLHRGWNKSDVARYFDVHQSIASRWMNDDDPLQPGDELLADIAEWLGADVEDLRAIKYRVVPRVVSIEQLTNAVKALSESNQALKERVKALEDRLGGGEAIEPSPPHPPRQSRKPTVVEFTSEAPPTTG